MSAYEQYTSFMQSLFSPEDTVCFALIKKDSPVKHIFASASEAFTERAFEALQNQNEKYNVFVGMNPFKPELCGKETGRTKENVQKVKRLYADADVNGDAVLENIRTSTKIPQPGVILNTSPGRYQFIWNVDGLTQQSAEPLLRAIAQEFGTDPAVAEIARVLRVPGLKNHKHAGAPEVVVVGDIEADIYDRVDFKLQANSTEAPKVEIARNSENLVKVGHIHFFMLSVAGKLRENGLTPDEIEPILRRRVHEECETPPNGFDDSKIVAMARSTKSWEPGKNTDLVLSSTFDEQSETSSVVPITLAGDLFKQGKSAEEINAIIQKMVSDAAVKKESEWRNSFRSVGELDSGEIRMLINNFMPEGTNFIGGLPGGGKTWLALSMVKALTTGRLFLGREDFTVPAIIPCLYLIPEVGARAFRKRLEKFRIPNDPKLFLCRTISEGSVLSLADPVLIGAIKSMSPVVFLDTAIRFNTARDENSAMQNKALVDAMIQLRQLGAVSVIALHHSSKAMRKEEMTLENVLRGTGDMAASADCVYGLQRDDKLYDEGRGPEEIDVRCVKPRDFNPPAPFRISASRKSDNFITSYKFGLVSNIDEYGDFLVVSENIQMNALVSKVNELLTTDPKRTLKELLELTGAKQWKIREALKSNGWTKSKTSDVWVKGIPENAQPVVRAPKALRPPSPESQVNAVSFELAS
jgi:RepB DNA-primase from phage plasmid/AAA domain